MQLLLIVIYKIIIIIFDSLLIFFFFFQELVRSSDDVPVHSLVALPTTDSCRTVLALVVLVVDGVVAYYVCLGPVAVDPNDVLEAHRLIMRHEMGVCGVKAGPVEWNPEESARLMGNSSDDR